MERHLPTVEGATEPRKRPEEPGARVAPLPLGAGSGHGRIIDTRCRYSAYSRPWARSRSRSSNWMASRM